MSDWKELWPSGPLYTGESFGTDSLALADFANGEGAKRACDLGCGCGILQLLLAHTWPELTVDGIEKRPEAAAQCRGNLAANGWSERCSTYTADVGELPPALGDYDLVVSNPPYYTGRPSPNPQRDAQRRESIPVAHWCATAAKLLRPGGDYCVVFPAARLTDMLCALRGADLEPKELRFLAHRPGVAPSVFLCRARKGGQPGLTLSPTLYQTDESGRETAEYRKICHWEAM